MNQHDVIRFMGRFPDEINPPRMLSKHWKCSTCGKIHSSVDEVAVPSPCNKCNGIFFEKTAKAVNTCDSCDTSNECGGVEGECPFGEEVE